MNSDQSLICTLNISKFQYVIYFFISFHYFIHILAIMKGYGDNIRKEIRHSPCLPVSFPPDKCVTVKSHCDKCCKGELIVSVYKRGFSLFADKRRLP